MSRKTRDSNMELLRLVAMLLVMMVHASYRALPRPDDVAIADHPLSVFLQFLTISYSVIGVDVFVMLSGWYGIRPRGSRLAELIFQLLFFGLVCIGIEYVVLGGMPSEPLKNLFLLNPDNYWFVKVYLALYLFAPVLNAFAESATHRQFAVLLMAVFGFQAVFGWVFEATDWLRAGYSLPSFMALYLLARYMRIHQPWFTKFNRSTDFSIYIATGGFMTLAVFFLRHYNLGGFLFFYNSPIVIIEAMFFLLFFSKFRFSSKPVNWVAASALAIYLTHSNSYLAKYYDGTIFRWTAELPYLSFILCCITLIITVFCVSILLDKVRLLLWHPIENHFIKEKKDEKVPFPD